MKHTLAHVAIVVDDYDEAIAFYTQKLGFQLLEDTVLSSIKDGLYYLLKVVLDAVCY